jgi:hypothetical protein
MSACPLLPSKSSMQLAFKTSAKPVLGHRTSLDQVSR